jgi:hypothetical protein
MQLLCCWDEYGTWLIKTLATHERERVTVDPAECESVQEFVDKLQAVKDEREREALQVAVFKRPSDNPADELSNALTNLINKGQREARGETEEETWARLAIADSRYRKWSKGRTSVLTGELDELQRLICSLESVQIELSVNPYLSVADRPPKLAKTLERIRWDALAMIDKMLTGKGGE